MAFKKYSTQQLKKYQKILLTIAILALILMCVALGIALYDISHQKESNLLYLIPTVFGPLAILPSIFSASIGSELKKRDKKDS